MTTNTPLPKIAWLFGKGTIACRADSNLETISYAVCPGSKPIMDFSEAKALFPEVHKVVDVVQTYEGSSVSTAKGYLDWAKWIISLDSDLPVVITRGTGTLTDMAFFLDLVLQRPGPVVITGSMRPISALSTDGHYNLVQACSLAVHPSARNRGIMLLFSDRITPAFYAVKSSANHLDTFKCLEAGHLGLMNNLTPHFFYEPSKATKKPFFDISKYQNLPKVALLHCYIDMDLDELEKKASDPETKGVVIAGWGASLTGGVWNEVAVELGKKGFPIVRASQCPDAHVTPTYSTRNQIAAGDLPPHKAYLLLRLALAAHGQDLSKIRQAFGTDFEPIPVPE